MTKITNLKGVYGPTLIPIKTNGEVDYQKMKQYYDYLINSKINGLMIFGSVGEFTSFSLEERKKIADRALRIIDGRVPTIVNCTSTVFNECKELAKEAVLSGADFISLLPPYYTLLSYDALIKYIEEFCHSIDSPIILYNVPFSAKNEITPQMMYELVKEKKITNIVGIKDASDNPFHLSHMLDICRKNKLAMFVAMEYVLLPMIILGASGSISPITNIVPNKMVELYESIKNKKYEKALDIYFKIILPLVDAVYYSKNFPAAIKEIMRLLGIDIGTVRKPLTPIDYQSLRIIKIKLKEAKLL
jgi:4-hydroxy-tetrahydrodipicolinate synthase